MQFVAFLVVSDLLQWSLHNLLHRVPDLWEFHKVHRSVTNMDWVVSFHFHWMEIVVYKSLQAIPLALPGANYRSAFRVFVLGAAWGHFNHRNLDVGLGPLGYVLNNPRMHLWHHDPSTEGGAGLNFGIVFSVREWRFRTAYRPRERSPDRIGYPGRGEMPSGLRARLLWPLTRVRRT